MAKLKAIGSEKLEGADKLKRIMEIATYRMPLNNINENASEYSINLPDGMDYHIVKEKQGYIIKKGVNESTLDYMEPMKNRKYFSSYSQALRKLNLIIKESNEINGQNEEVKLFGEQKKFVLKTPAPPTPEVVAPAVPAEPMALPEPELPMDDMGGDDELDLGMDTELDLDVPAEEPMTGGEDMEERVSFKVIQKLTGKLTQKMRALEDQEGMSSEDIKYVINMVLSSFDLNELSEEDREDILSKFEDETEDLGGDDMDGEDLTDDSEVEDIQADMDIPMESEFEEGFMYDDVDDDNPDDFNFDEFEVSYEPKKSMKKFGDYGNGAILDSIFSESKVDKVLSKYFEISKKEILESKQKNVQKNTKRVSDVREKMKSIVKLTESIEQELASQKFLEENINAKIVGKTNKNNLVFENKGKEVKITPEGLLI